MAGVVMSFLTVYKFATKSILPDDQIKDRKFQVDLKKLFDSKEVEDKLSTFNVDNSRKNSTKNKFIEKIIYKEQPSFLSKITCGKIKTIGRFLGKYFEGNTNNNVEQNQVQQI